MVHFTTEMSVFNETVDYFVNEIFKEFRCTNIFVPVHTKVPEGNISNGSDLNKPLKPRPFCFKQSTPLIKIKTIEKIFSLRK